MPTIVHFDIAADDVQRAKSFYEQLFGWKIKEVPYGPDGYYLIETKDAYGDKGLGGGIAKREQDYQGIINYVEVDALDESIEKLKSLGGRLIEPKTQIPSVGYIAVCQDPEGNKIGLIEEA